MSLGRRVRRLEGAHGGDGCPECGLAPGAPVEDYQVAWDAAEDAAPVAPEWCETCGRQTVFVVGWSDLPEAAAGGGG